MSDTALVHPDTAKLPPDQQAKAIVVYTSPEELAARTMTPEGAASANLVHAADAALADAISESLPYKTTEPRQVSASPLLAAPYGRKVVRRSLQDKADIYPAVSSLVMMLDAQRKEQLFINLAQELGYSVE